MINTNSTDLVEVRKIGNKVCQVNKDGEFLSLIIKSGEGKLINIFLFRVTLINSPS